MAGIVRGVTSVDKVFTVGTDTSILERRIRRQLGNDLPKVVVKAINDTIRPAKDDYKAEIARRYDRPTRFTMNATFLRFANQAKPVGTMYFKDEAPKGTPAGKYLKPTIRGTARKHKGFEKRLIAMGLMMRNEYAIPGKGVRRNQYGNVSNGVIQKVLSGLGAQREASQNTTVRSQGRRIRQAIKGKRTAVRYFVANGNDHLDRGVYEARGLKGNKIKPVFIFTTDTPNYRIQLPFKRIAEVRVKREFPKNLKKRARLGLKS